MKKTKKYQEALKKIDKSKKYSIDEALTLLPELSLSKFAGSLEVEILLNLKEKQKKEIIKGSYTLPNQFGESVKILAFVDPANQTKAKDADVSGGEELIEKVEKGEVDYDVVVATPAMMPKIAKLGKTLGTKGLMPNPKNGTVTDDIEATIAKFKSGTKNFASKEGGKLTAIFAKSDMSAEKIKENFDALYKAVRPEMRNFGAEPIKSIKMKPTMGPAISVDPKSLD